MSTKRRLLNMSINALIGYLIVEIFALLASYLGIISMGYRDIFQLALIVDGGTLLFIIIIYKIRNPSRTMLLFFFYAELSLYIVSYSIVLMKLHEFRIFVLVLALIALTIEMPFTNYKESLMISVSSAVAQVVVSYYAIYYLHQQGSFIQSLFYTICFIPIFILISYITQQIIEQKNKINEDKHLLADMNERLRQTNVALHKTNTIAEKEIELAAQVQKLLLPRVPENVPGWDIAMSFKPKYGVSGDFYDFYYKNDRLRGLAIFDVSGHGVSSSLITMIVKPITYRIFDSMEDFNIGTMISSVNDNVSREISLLDHFISCILLRFKEEAVEYANAGHPDLLLKKEATGIAQFISATTDNARGGPIGIHSTAYQPAFTRFGIDKNDILVLYTDCIVESHNNNRERYGFVRLLSSFQDAPSGPAHKVLTFMLEKFYQFIKDVEVRDDFTIIVAKKTV